MTLTGKGNFTGSKTLTWTIKSPTGAFADDAFATTSTLVFDQTAQAWVTTSTLAWPCPSGSISTWRQFTALEKAIFTVDGETFNGKEAKNGITCSAENKTLDQKYNIIESATWKVNSTAAELDAAEGADVEYTMAACGLVWGDKFGLVSYGDDEGIRATNFMVTIATKDLALMLPAAATYDLGATKLENVKIQLGVGASVTTTTEQTDGQIFTTETGYRVVKTEEGGVYTYTTDLLPITITVNPLEHASVTVKVGEKTIETIGNNQYVVSYGNTVVVTYTADETGWKPSPQVKTLENVTEDQSVSGEEMKYYHDHLFKYEKNGATLTATCTNMETTCVLDDRQVALTLKIADKTFDGAAAIATLDNEDAFTNATLAAVGAIKYYANEQEVSAPINVGTYKAQVLVAPGDIDGIVLEKTFTISVKPITGATVTLSNTRVIETGSDITVSITSVTDGSTTFATTDYNAAGTFTAKERGDYTITVTFKGNYEGSATAMWSIVEPTGAFSATAASIKSGDPAYGTIEGNVLTIDDASKMVYSEGTWSAAMTITWPREVTYASWDVFKGFPQTVQYTDEAHAKMVVTGGTTANETDTAWYYKNGKVGATEYTYVKSTTWTVSVTKESLKAAPLDEEGYACFTNTMSSVAWGTTTAGNVTGIQDTDFIIRIKPGDLEKDISAATTELVASYNYDFTEKVNSLGTVKYGDTMLVENEDYTVDASSVFRGTGNGKTDENFTVIINGIGDFKGTKTMTWTIKAPETELTDVAKASDEVGGELVGTTLWMTNGTSYGWEKYYTADEAPDGSGIAGFYAGIQIAWPYTISLIKDGRYTNLEHGYFKVNGATAWTNATETIPGLTFSKLGSIFDYISKVTFWQRLTIEDLKAAEAAGEDFVTHTLTAIGLTWEDEFFGVKYGDSKGVKETDFAIITKLEGLELYQDGYLVWPEHAHVWQWTVGEGGSVLTASCTKAGCRYKANPAVLTIAPTTVAEKYCDTTPLTATVTGGDTLASITGATVGEIAYFEGEEELGAAPTMPGEYTAECTVVSADEATTNTIATTLRILTGQAICNGVHVADAAEYFEKKTQDAMMIYVGKDFTAAQTYVVPANWKAGTFTEYEMTMAQFIQNVRDGKYGDLYTWDDVRDLIAGRTTLQELFQRLKEVSEDFTLIDCGTKTINLAGFTVTAAEGLPLFWNQGTLVLTGEGTLTVGEDGGETLIVNDGTLSIESGTYVGSITNSGSLVISGGYFTGEIINGGEGTVVLTGGAYEIEPDEDFVPSGYDLVERDGIWYVERHEHKYTFLPLGRCMMSCTCWNWFVDDSDQWIQFSNCNAHKLSIFIATRDDSTGILPKRKYDYTGKPVEANIVGYNLQAIKDIGILKNISELVDIAEEASDANSNWDEMTAIEKFQTMMGILNSIEDLDLDFTNLIWDVADIESETGLKFGEIKYYNTKTDEELSGAPVETGRYKASVVITTPKGNEVTRSWKFTIGSTTSNLEDWWETTKTNIEDGWAKFKQNVKDLFNREADEEDVEEYYDSLAEEEEEESSEPLKLTTSAAPLKLTTSSVEEENPSEEEGPAEEEEDDSEEATDDHCEEYRQLVAELKAKHLAIIAQAKQTDADIRATFENNKQNLQQFISDAKTAIETRLGELKDKHDMTVRDIQEFFDSISVKCTGFFDELQQKGNEIDQQIITTFTQTVEKIEAFQQQIEEAITDHVYVYLVDNQTNFVYNAEEQGPKIWGVYCGLDKLNPGIDYEVEGVTNATEIGEYAFTVKGLPGKFYERLNQTIDWTIVEPTGTFKEGAFEVCEELVYDDEAKTWNTVATLEWPRSLEQIFRAPRYYTVDYAAAESTENYTAASVEPMVREFYRIKTGAKEQYLVADIWTLAFTPEQLTAASEAGLTAITNTLTAYAIGSESAPEGMAKTNFEYVVNLEGLKLYDEMGRQCYPIHNHEWQFKNDEDGALKADCFIKSCPVSHVEVSIDAESKDWDEYPVRAEIVDEDDQFAIHTYAEIGAVQYATAAGEELAEAPEEPGEYVAFAYVVTPNAVTNRVWKNYEIRQIDLSEATVYTEPEETEFVYSESERTLKVDTVIVNGCILVEGRDFTVGGTTNATEVGSYQIVIEGTGHFYGTRTIDWTIVEPTRPFADDAFNQVVSELPAPLERLPYGDITNGTLTITASTNLWYDTTRSNWFAGVTVDWPAQIEQIIKTPQYTVPAKAYVEIATPSATNTYSVLDILNGEATNDFLVAETGEFYRIRYGRNEQYVKQVGWDIEVKIADIIAARAKGEDSITYTITVGSPAHDEDPEGLAATTYTIVLPIDENLLLLDEERQQVYPFEVGEIEVTYATSFTNFVWTGAEQGPTVTAAYWRGIKLTKDVDYTVLDDTATDVDDYTTVVAGTGDSCNGAEARLEWKIVKAIDKFADDAFTQQEGERGPFGTLEGDTLTVTDSTNLYYDVTSSNWYAGVNVAWPSNLDSTLKNPQYTVPADATVEITTPFTNLTFTGAQILAGEADEFGLVLSTNALYSAVTDSAWDIEITLADIIDAKSAGLTEFAYTITVTAPKSATNPTAFSKTYTIVLPFTGLVLEDAEANRIHVVTFDANGGTFTDGTGTNCLAVIEGKPFGTLPDVMREDFDFVNWETESGDVVTTTTIVTDELVRTIMAKWNRKTYSICFHLYDGTPVVTNIVFEYGVVTKLPSVADLGFVREGFDFAGWATSAGLANLEKVWKGDEDYVAKPIAAGKTINAYPIWKVRNGFFAFKFIGNDGTGRWKSIAYRCGERTTLPLIATELKWKRAPFVAQGWSKSSVNNIVWKFDGADISTDISDGEMITIYVVWAENPNTYNICLHKNDGSCASNLYSFTYGLKTMLPSIASQHWLRDGWDFIGWATSQERAAAGEVWKYDTGIVASPTGIGLTLNAYAIWQLSANHVAITYHSEDDVTADEQVVYSTEESLILPVPTREGFDFVGWARTKDGDVWKAGGEDVSDQFVAGSSYDLYAKWELSNGYYALDFYAADGTGRRRMMAFEYGVKTSLPSVNDDFGWSRDGYEFAGWSLSENDDIWKPDCGIVKTGIEAGTVRRVHAVWALKSCYYAITYNKNDGTGEQITVAYEYGVVSQLCDVEKGLGWTRDGYEFKYWSFSPSGSCWKYNCGGVQTGIPKGVTRNIYAIWGPVAGSAAQSRFTSSAGKQSAKSFTFTDTTYTGVLADGDGTFCVLLENGSEGEFDAYLYVNGEACDAEAVAAGSTLTIITEDDVRYTMTKVGGVWTLTRK